MLLTQPPPGTWAWEMFTICCHKSTTLFEFVVKFGSIAVAVAAGPTHRVMLGDVCREVPSENNPNHHFDWWFPASHKFAFFITHFPHLPSPFPPKKRPPPPSRTSQWSTVWSRHSPQQSRRGLLAPCPLAAAWPCFPSWPRHQRSWWAPWSRRRRESRSWCKPSTWAIWLGEMIFTKNEVKKLKEKYTTSKHEILHDLTCVDNGWAYGSFILSGKIPSSGSGLQMWKRTGLAFGKNCATG